MTHRRVREALYEYLRQELPEEERQQVARHLEGCAACRGDLTRLKSVMAAVVPPAQKPSDALSKAYWQSFVDSVEQRIAAKPAPVRSRLADTWDVVHSFVFFHRGSFAIAGGALAMALLAFIFLTRPSVPEQHFAATDTTVQVTPDAYSGMFADSTIDAPEVRHKESTRPRRIEKKETASAVFATDRVSQYFRKSKILLIGITNLKTEDGQKVDLSAERRTSRALIQEARYLKQQPLTPHAEELIDQLNRILIELANVAEQDQSPNIEIIRGGIHQENLLFRIRMAETALDTISSSNNNHSL